MEVTAEITAKIKIPVFYESIFKPNLDTISLFDYITKHRKATCLIESKGKKFALSRLTTPKRSRSGTYERIYNLLSTDERAVIIPVIKDEGINDKGKSSNFDVIQWDTISLLNLLGVHIIFGYYKNADQHRIYSGKITNQRFDNSYIQKRLTDFCNYSGTPQDWNLNELSRIPELFELSKKSYQSISLSTQNSFYREKSFNRLIAESKDLLVFRDKSRHRASLAQAREISILQPKEVLSTSTKSKITITDFLGGKYFFTVDETKRDAQKRQITLTECKNSKSKLPSMSHIKDGLLKMVFFSSISEIMIGGVSLKHKSVLQLTSGNVGGVISSESKDKEYNRFFQSNQFNQQQVQRTLLLFEEARKNGFVVKVGNE